MIEKSAHYAPEETIYQYGYYDGFHKAIEIFRRDIPNFDDLISKLP